MINYDLLFIITIKLVDVVTLYETLLDVTFLSSMIAFGRLNKTAKEQGYQPVRFEG